MKKFFLLVFLLFLLTVEITPVSVYFDRKAETRMYDYQAWFKIDTSCVNGERQERKKVCYRFYDSDGVFYSGCYPPGD